MSTKSRQSAGERRKAPSREGRPGKLANLRRDEIVRLSLALVPAESIAERLGISRDRVGRMLAEPALQLRIASARATAFEDARAEMRGATRRAVGVLVELLESRDETVRERAAVDLLKLSGLAAPKRIDLGILAASTDDELWARLRELEQQREDERARLGAGPTSDGSAGP